MTEPRSVTKLIAPLLFVDNIPLRAVALVGEAITADARLSDLGEGKTVRSDLDAIIELTSSYEIIQELAAIAVGEFEESCDGNRLIKQLSDIRDGLIALY